LGEVYSKVIGGRSWQDWGRFIQRLLGAEAAEVGGIGGGLFKGYWGQKQLRLAGLGRFIQRLLGTVGDIRNSGRPPGIGRGLFKDYWELRGT